MGNSSSNGLVALDARIKSGHDGAQLSLPGLTRQSRAENAVVGSLDPRVSATRCLRMMTCGSVPLELRLKWKPITRTAVNDRVFDAAPAQAVIILRSRRRRQIEKGLVTGIPGGQNFVQVLLSHRLSVHSMAPQDPGLDHGQIFFQSGNLVMINTAVGKSRAWFVAVQV